MKIWGCVYCRKDGKPFTVPRTLDGYNELARHFHDEHPGKVVTKGQIPV